MGAGTFYLYIEERCNGEQGYFLTGVRFGLIDTLFEQGHIVFDNALDPGTDSRLTSEGIRPVFAAAWEGGAEYIVVVAVISTVEKTTARADRIAGSCVFRLYDVENGTLLGKGAFALDNAGREHEFEKDALGFEIGRRAACLIADINLPQRP